MATPSRSTLRNAKCSRFASAHFSTSARGSSSGLSLGSGWLSQPDPTEKPDGHRHLHHDKGHHHRASPTRLCNGWDRIIRQRLLFVSPSQLRTVCNPPPDLPVCSMNGSRQPVAAFILDIQGAIKISKTGHVRVASPTYSRMPSPLFPSASNFRSCASRCCAYW